ncbi:unnamed protein product [Lactuca saligna]|uniref:Zinc finger PHD-type domain-containing protein n=1 Tax=Lactuca saligna TaxID=75948 RepID=A0AA35ZB14_LACSI|nr:unnamed protein product [Lactuca saligna]
MVSSDDEEETVADTISEYYFCDGDDEPLSFSVLPLQWSESESESSSPTTGIFLRGTADNGLQKLYKAVKAWKYDLSKSNPEISVLSKDNHWIKLQKPRKSFENEIKTILITVHCLSYLKRKPEASAKSLWDHLSKVFSLHDVRPSENDLRGHKSFIRDAVDRDETLAKSKVLAAFLENPRKRKVSEEAEAATKPSFIVDDANDDDFVIEANEDSESDEEEDPFDSVCAICDNGGRLTCCDGKCFRSFHATPDTEEAEESNCKSLGLTPDQVKRTQQFLCDNCLYSQHQCSVCGKLGSSDKSSGAAEVFRCSSATCGHFYHPKCVAKILQPNVEAEQKNLLEKISAGEPFICPAHKCDVCKQTENEKVEDLQFAICRRCPKSYHRKCLPRGIMFESQVGDDDIVRAWDDLLGKSRALIYCLNHDIDKKLGTPARTLIFRINRHSISNMDQPSKLPLKNKETLDTDSEYTSKKPVTVIKSQKGGEKSSATKMEDSSSKKRAAVGSVPLEKKKKKPADTSLSLRRSLSAKIKMPSSSSNDGQPSLGCRLFEYMNKGTESNNLEKDDMSVDESKQMLSPIDEESKQRILDLMKDAASSITLEEVKRYHTEKVPSTHAMSSRVDKSIILGRVEGAVEALHVALKKLEEGCSVEDAMAVCEPGVLDQLMRWKDKLKVYLAPFLHGMRYTSFGRHFTKVEKLEKIVEKLKFYVEDGDTVVDFCCGANDFSFLMKKHLDEMGKNKCSYKNYDITRPKNDFYFEKRDWMSVRPNELPKRLKLIMGLNPPFGKNAALANQFIQQAVKFMPKLIILIVPPETERYIIYNDIQVDVPLPVPVPLILDDLPTDKTQKERETPKKKQQAQSNQTSFSKKRRGKQVDKQSQKKLKLEDNKYSRGQGQDLDDKPVPEPPKKLDIKRPSPGPTPTPIVEDEASQSFEHRHLERRYNPAPPPPTSEVMDYNSSASRSRNDILGQSVNQHRYNTPTPTTTEEAPPYMGGSGTTYRRPDSANNNNNNLPTPSSGYSMRPAEPSVQYHHNAGPGPGPGGYDSRGGSYVDEMGAGGSRRYGGHDMASYNNNSNRAGTSTMQRYAPRLDELNHTRMDDMNHSRMGMGMGNSRRPEPPPMPMPMGMGMGMGIGNNNNHNNRGFGGYGPPMHGPGFGTEPMGFAPGPYNPYSHHNSSGGWLNE